MRPPPPAGSRRNFASPERSRTRNVDSAERTYRWIALGLSPAGFVMGMFVSLFLYVKGYGVPIVGLLLVPFGCAAFVYFGALFITGRAGAAATLMYNPSGASTPHQPEFSRAESLAARGRYGDAVDAFRAAAEEHPDDPRPLLRAARILRDDLGRLEDAVSLFREIRRTRTLTRGVEVLVTREVAEIYLHRLDRPLGAAPELARLAERFPGTPEGEWAGRTLEEVRRALTDRSPDGEG